MIGIRNAKYERENKGESIGVTDETGSPIGQPPEPPNAASKCRTPPA
jgi:hypothetical protein